MQLDTVPLQLPRVVAGGRLARVVAGVHAEEGLRAFWRGNVAAMLMWAAYGGVQFPLYSALRERLNLLCARGSGGSCGGGGGGGAVR
jgi:hypothetical protein